jgi:peptide/nickel transport system permease protein
MTQTLQETSEERKPKSAYGRKAEYTYALKLLISNKLVLIGLAISVASIVISLISGYLVPANAWSATHGAQRLCWSNPILNWNLPNSVPCPVGSNHPLGTDTYGRDLLQMMIMGLPIDLELAFGIVASALAIGVSLGAVAAYAGGKTDEAILRVTDIFFAFPALVLAIVILAVVGRSLFNLGIATLIVWWPLYVRLMRSQILSEKEKSYVEALRSVGAGRMRILFRHIIPNSIYPVLVQATLDIGGVILTFSALMFLGFSPNALLPELGQLTTNGIEVIASAPWLVVFPGLTILIVALGWNLLGDGVRDVLDPRLRR